MRFITYSRNKIFSCHELRITTGKRFSICTCSCSSLQSSLHDLIIKNLDKIKKPRNANTDNMY